MSRAPVVRAVSRKPMLRSLALWLAAASLLGAAQWLSPYSLGYNSTHSLPTGLYLTKTLAPGEAQVGDIVCFEYHAPEWAATRRYFPEGSRLCKFLHALPGTPLVVDEAGLWVGAKVGPRLAEFALKDSQGRPLPSDALKTGPVGGAFAVVLTPAHKNSLDSRLLGPIPLEQITHKAWPLWTKD